MTIRLDLPHTSPGYVNRVYTESRLKQARFPRAGAAYLCVFLVGLTGRRRQSKAGWKRPTLMLRGAKTEEARWIMMREFCEKNEGEKSGECSLRYQLFLVWLQMKFTACIWTCYYCVAAVFLLLRCCWLSEGLLYFLFLKKIFFNSDIKQRRDDLELSLSLAQAVVACNLRQVLFCQTKSSAGLQEPGGGGGGVGHQPPSTLLCGAPSAESSELGLGLLESRSAPVGWCAAVRTISCLFRFTLKCCEAKPHLRLCSTVLPRSWLSVGSESPTPPPPRFG